MGPVEFLMNKQAEFDWQVMPNAPMDTPLQRIQQRAVFASLPYDMSYSNGLLDAAADQSSTPSMLPTLGIGAAGLLGAGGLGLALRQMLKKRKMFGR